MGAKSPLSATLARRPFAGLLAAASKRDSSLLQDLSDRSTRHAPFSRGQGPFSRDMHGLPSRPARCRRAVYCNRTARGCCFVWRACIRQEDLRRLGAGVAIETRGSRTGRCAGRSLGGTAGIAGGAGRQFRAFSVTPRGPAADFQPAHSASCAGRAAWPSAEFRASQYPASGCPALRATSGGQPRCCTAGSPRT